MEYILNELSLNGQYPGIEEFYTSGLSHINNILNEIRISNALLLKKSDFYGREVMPGVQLYQILYNEGARINDSIRRMKVTLGALQKRPYWDENSCQDSRISSGG